MIIAYQGIPGSYSFICANKYFKDHNLSADAFIGTNQFKEIFELVLQNKADYGVIPVENSLAGSVYENYDLLTHYNLQVVGEYYLKIEHCLLGTSEDIADITNVYSHPKALEQCQKLFDQYKEMKKNVYSDTASAAEYVKDKQKKNLAAIASSDAADLYQLKIIQKNIEDNPYNFTRFLIITKNKAFAENANKCSIVFKLFHKPGSLYKTLKIFADNNLNLTKIESRPIHGKPFEYYFHVDLEFNGLGLDKIKKILDGFISKVLKLKILGYYKSDYENIS